MAQSEVLPNLRHAGVFHMSTMVNLGIGFKEPLTCPGAKKYLLYDSATWPDIQINKNEWCD